MIKPEGRRKPPLFFTKLDAEQIRENPYLQFFLGLSEFREDYLFDPSMMGHFRARFGEEAHQRINTAIIE